MRVPEEVGWSRWLWLVGAVAVAIAGAAVAVGMGERVGVREGERRSADDGPDDVGARRARSAPAEDGPWRTYTDPDTARVVAPAPDGSVWVGTRTAGLVHWDADGDGYQRQALPDDDGRDRGVHALAVADDGTVWAATHRLVRPSGPAALEAAGLVRFDGRQWTSHELGEEVPGAWVSTLATGDDGRVWAIVESHAGTAADGGVARFVDGEWTTDTAELGLPGTPTSLAIDSDGAVWVAAPGGVARFADRQWASWRADGALPGAGVSSLSVTENGVWVATHGGVARFADGRWTSWTTEADVPGDWIVTLAAGADGSVWAVSAGGRPEPEGSITDAALVRFDGDGWSRAAHAPFDAVRSLAVDGDGMVWAVTRQRMARRRWESGLSRFDGQAWTDVGREDGLPHDDVHALTIADDGAAWAATAGGAARFAGGTGTPYVTGAGPPGERVAAVALGDEAVWVGGRAGVARLAGGEWTSWSVADGLADEEVHALAIGDDGTVWAGTAGGVSRFDGDEWTSWGVDDGLPQPEVRSVAVAGDGTVWAVTGDVPAEMGFPSEAEVANGIARFDGRDWTGWTGPDAPGPGLAVDVTVDDRGIAWVAAATPMVGPDEPRPAASVSRFRAGEWATDTTDDQLPGTDVAAIDAAGGTVWLGTDHGLARHDGNGWDGPLPADLPPDGGVSRHTSHVVAVDADTVWMNHGHGLARVDARDGATLDPVSDAPFREVEALAADDEAVWVGTAHGLVRFDVYH